jgi:hypothetical protein
MNARLWIAGWQQLVRAAVAVDASSCFIVSTLHGFAVETAVVSSLLVRVATRAGDFFRGSFVTGTLYVSVAVDAGKHAAVDRIFKGLRIDMQADGFSVDVVGQAGIAVARQAFVSGGLRWFFSGCMDETGG